MQIVPSGIAHLTLYGAFDYVGLFVRLDVYERVDADNEILLAQVPMRHLGNGIHKAEYQTQNGKSYILHAIPYTDDTYAVRSDRSPVLETVYASNFIQQIGAGGSGSDSTCYMTAHIRKSPRVVAVVGGSRVTARIKDCLGGPA